MPRLDIPSDHWPLAVSPEAPDVHSPIETSPRLSVWVEIEHFFEQFRVFSVPDRRYGLVLRNPLLACLRLSGSRKRLENRGHCGESPLYTLVVHRGNCESLAKQVPTGTRGCNGTQLFRLQLHQDSSYTSRVPGNGYWRDRSVVERRRFGSPLGSLRAAKGGRSSVMRQNTERWMQLCAQAAIEQDPDKLLALVQEINDLLEEKERRLGINPIKPLSDGKSK